MGAGITQCCPFWGAPALHISALTCWGADGFLIPVTSVHACTQRHTCTKKHAFTHTHIHACVGIYTCKRVLTDVYTCNTPAHMLPAHTCITCRCDTRITPACAHTTCTCVYNTDVTHTLHPRAHTHAHYTRIHISHRCDTCYTHAHIHSTCTYVYHKL